MNMHEPIYRHSTVLASGIPLGGIGTGSVELRADGRFHDWEIFNNYLWSGDHADAPPVMWSEDAFFAVRVKPEGGPPRVRLLYDDDKKSNAADSWYEYAMMYNFPFLRNVRGITYSGQHPFARMEYEDPQLPLDISLEAFSPFIPFNAKDSALPLAFFVFTMRNRGAAPCDASLMFSLRNCVGYDLDEVTLNHAVRRDGATTRILMTAGGMDAAHRTFGSMALMALDPAATCMPAWTDGRGMAGFENAASPALSQLFHPFRECGELRTQWEGLPVNLGDMTDESGRRGPSGKEQGQGCPSGTASGQGCPSYVRWERRVVRQKPGKQGRAELHDRRQLGLRWRGALCQKVRLEPGEQRECVFVMAWHFPNHYHYFDKTKRLGHMYEHWFAGADDVAAYGAAHFPRLRSESARFCDELYTGSMPAWLAASLNAQLTTFPQSFWWTKDGEVAAWEGSACCQIIPNIHTIWSSFQPLLFFPDLYVQMKRRMAAFGREGDETCHAGSSLFLELEQQRRRMSNQANRGALGGWFAQRYKQLGYDEKDFVPGGRRRTSKAFLHIGSAVQLLRDYQWTGDGALLDDVWPMVRENIEHGMKADANGDGLQDGAISFLTYDHWFPPAANCYKATMWLAELSAAAALARLRGENAFARKCQKMLQTGAQSFERLFWNGEYYNLCRDDLKGADDAGCLADQVSGHLYLRLCGLPPVHDEDHVRSALRAVSRHNCTPEDGMINGADPRGRDDWRYFARYSARGDDERCAGQWVTPWTGTEYYVAAVMLAEGLVDEGFAVARDVYERHVAMGMLYNQIECGEHYFRPMAAWAMLPALQGLVYDRTAGALTIAPKTDADAFDSVFILPGAWGRARHRRDDGTRRFTLELKAGALALQSLVLPLWKDVRQTRVTVDGTHVDTTAQPVDGALRIALGGCLSLTPDATLEACAE